MDDHCTVRWANTADLSQLQQLYTHLITGQRPVADDIAAAAFAALRAIPGSGIFVGDVAGKLVTSCTLVVIPNLTRAAQPYALIENVVTHTDHRKQGHAKRVLDAATAAAWEAGCYKIMLMTGKSDAGTQAFYQRAGFAQTKTGLQKRRIPPRAS